MERAAAVLPPSQELADVYRSSILVTLYPRGG